MSRSLTRAAWAGLYLPTSLLFIFNKHVNRGGQHKLAFGVFLAGLCASQMDSPVWEEGENVQDPGGTLKRAGPTLRAKIRLVVLALLPSLLPSYPFICVSPAYP